MPTFLKYSFLLLFVVVACDPTSSSKSSTNTDLVVGESDNGQAVSFSSDARLVVKLPCNPSTGYSWQVVQCDTSVVRETGECVFVPNDTARDGAPGTCSFSFETGGKGRTEIRMLYARWWEVPPVPIDSFRVAVAVQ
jgi:inhibitor of cysteine peptidase